MYIAVDFPDFEQHYMEFMQSSQHPKLERLNEWGKQRFFLAKYFDVVDDQHDTLQMVLHYQQQKVRLNLRQAPEFMQKEAYLTWLKAQFSQYIV
ncbi:hypothetical protein [uncultured Acinetobacter sp.]|uniref:hypothetical protein n=1 Tax=uncultured Acinetobacter sp. TaxID=165433 RepID=UPI0026031992|nr:hypothetical protein [uncultured Acinetobacter sp.]